MTERSHPGVSTAHARPENRRGHHLVVGSRHPALLLFAAASSGIAIDRGLDRLVGTSANDAAFRLFNAEPGAPDVVPRLQLWLALAGIATAVWLGLHLARRTRVASVFLLSAWLACGGAWHFLWWHGYPSTEIGLSASVVGGPAAVEVRVVGEPRRMALAEPSLFDARPSEPRTLVPCRVESVRAGDVWEPRSGNLDLYVRAEWREVNAGDRLRVVGELAAVAPSRNPGEFEFASHFRGQRKLAVLFADDPASIEILSRGQRWWERLRANWRSGLDNVIWQLVPSEYAGLASGVLLGNRQQIAAEQRDRFMLSSTVHVLSISGLHVGILAGLLFAMLRLGFLPRQVCLWGVILLVLLYAWLVEFSPPVTRAAVLICLFCASRLTGQNGFSLNLLAVAGLVVLFLNPTDLFNVGAQLSFLAVASMIAAETYRAPSPAPLDQLILATRSWPVRMLTWLRGEVVDAFWVSAVIWLLAAPLVAAQFRLVSPIGLLVNPLILLPMAGAMYCGMGVLLLGWWLPSLGAAAGWACGGCLGLMLWLVDWSILIPGGYAWTTAPAGWSLFLFYAGAWLLFLKPAIRVGGWWLLLAYLAWWAFAWALPQSWERARTVRNAGDFELTLVDVGHGLSTLVRLPDGRHLLYDAGSFGSSAFGLRSVAALLWERGIEHLDAVILSHADLDHFNALPELCRRFSIGTVYVSRQMWEHDSPAVQGLFAILREQQVKIAQLEAGDVLQTSFDCELACLGPPASGTGDGDNSDSVVLAISAGERRVLLTGDLEGAGLELLLRGPRLTCDVLVAPHHGSLGSLPAVLAAWSRPSLVLVSCSERRLDRESARQFEAAGAKVLATGELGAISVRFFPERLEYTSWIGSRFQNWVRH
ncbi:MAG: ComEC/Rec2 family competence protein [Planctomycetota bacterium]